MYTQRMSYFMCFEIRNLFSNKSALPRPWTNFHFLSPCLGSLHRCSASNRHPVKTYISERPSPDYMSAWHKMPQKWLILVSF